MTAVGFPLKFHKPAKSARTHTEQNGSTCDESESRRPIDLAIEFNDTKEKHVAVLQFSDEIEDY